MAGIKEPVRIRQKRLAGGNASLYLDIYYNGRRSYEFLRLYLIPERNKADRERNRQTMQLAASIKARRIVELESGAYGLDNARQRRTRFFDYYGKLMEGLPATTRSHYNWSSTLRILHAYEADPRITFKDIDRRWVEGFRDFLDKSTSLTANTKFMYFSKLKTCLNRACREGIIDASPAANVKGFKMEDSTRMYLTMDELRLLSVTGCRQAVVRRAFLFSCLTGLRFSDIQRLRWGDVEGGRDGFTRLIFRQKKTHGQEYLDITAQAVELMGERQDAACNVFPGIELNTLVNRHIARWVRDAGIGKHITFHCARHTFAVMMLDLGTDIYTVSKLLGHRELSTTQVYAKILDKNKQAAVAKIPDILGK